MTHSPQVNSSATSARHLSASLVAVCLFGLVGCQQLPLDISPHWSANIEQPPSNLVAKLSQDNWRANSNWKIDYSREQAAADHRPISSQRWCWNHREELEQAPHWDPLPNTDSVSSIQTPAWAAEEPFQSLSGGNVSSAKLPVETFLLREMATRDDWAGCNALILWAQSYPRDISPEQAEILEKIVAKPYTVKISESTPETPVEVKPSSPPLVKTQTLSLATRCAAAEAWCLVLAQHAAPETLASAQKILSDPQLPDEVRSELFIGLAGVMPLSEIPWLTAALKPADSGTAPPLVVRKGALTACIINAARNHGEGSTLGLDPAHYSHLENETTPSIRSLYAEWLITSGHPDALRVLERQLADTESQVSHAALVQLGRLRTLAASDLLVEQAQRNEEGWRIGVVHALAAWGPQELSRFARDEHPRVRMTVAHELKQYHDADGIRVLTETLSGPAHYSVEQACVETTRDWPDVVAIPWLLKTIASGSESAARLAVRELQRRNPEERYELATGVTVSEREKLVSEWSAQKGWSPLLIPVKASAPVQDSVPLPVDESRQAVWEGRLAKMAAGTEQFDPGEISRWLDELQPEDVLLLESLAATAAPQQAQWLIASVLPRISTEYACLADLRLPDVTRRRSGSQQLLATAQQHPLSSAVLRQLSTSLQTEQDLTVWRNCLAAVNAQATPEAASIAQLALNHQWPDIRLLGCEYFAKHGQFAHARWLMPLFTDANRDVRLAAIRAAVPCGNPVILDGLPGSPPLPGLRSQLTHPDDQLRLTVAATMSRFGDWAAMQELVRMSLHADWTIRREAVRAMGTSRQTRFIEKLISAVWTESNYTVRLSVLNSLQQLVPEQEWPAGLRGTQDYNRQVELWATWWTARSAIPGNARAVPAVSDLRG